MDQEQLASTNYSIKTEHFEGPLELLLSLIEKRKLFINDIALAKVTDDYIEHIKQFEQFPIGDTAGFILIASTLLLIKSKSLLPTLSLTEEEQGDITDLEDRLRTYQKFKELSRHLDERFGKALLFEKLPSKNITPVFSPDAMTTTAAISEAIRRVLHNLPKKEIIPKAIVRKVVSLEEMITRLVSRVNSNLRMSFHEFAKTGKAEKVHIIVSFLALLELVKQGTISVTQDEAFKDITIESHEKVGVPSYN